MSLGGNIGGLRPAFTDNDVAILTKKINYLKEGSLVRLQTIFWEIFWSPNDQGNFAGLDRALDIIMAKKMIPILMLAPCPYPDSLWYNHDHHDWWLPRKDVWPKIFEKLDILVKRVNAKYSNSKIKPMFQISNEPTGKCINPPLGEKPGGSNSTLMGEWHKDFHEFFYGIATVLKNNKVLNNNIISPAISCVQEGTMQEIAEWKSMTPPDQFNWMKYCGYRAYHVRFRAGWATDPKTRLGEVTRGFKFTMDYLDWSDKSKFPATPASSLSVTGAAAQKIILTEFYVTPGDCGCQFSDDLNPFRQIALNLINEKGWAATVWGLADEADVPGNIWLSYGGWGDFLNPKVVNPPTTDPTPTTNPVSGSKPTQVDTSPTSGDSIKADTGTK